MLVPLDRHSFGVIVIVHEINIYKTIDNFEVDLGNLDCGVIISLDNKIDAVISIRSGM